MPKDAQIYVRVTEEEKVQLEKLAEITKRTQSDMIRFLISQAWQEMRIRAKAPAVYISDAQPE